TTELRRIRPQRHCHGRMYRRVLETSLRYGGDHSLARDGVQIRALPQRMSIGVPNGCSLRSSGNNPSTRADGTSSSPSSTSVAGRNTSAGSWRSSTGSGTKPATPSGWESVCDAVLLVNAPSGRGPPSPRRPTAFFGQFVALGRGAVKHGAED